MARRRVAACAAAILLTLTAAGSALAVIPGTLDQHHECAGSDCNTPNDATYPAWYSGNGTGNNDATAGETIAQTFTAGHTGPLTAVSLFLAGIDGGTVPASFVVGVTNVDGSGMPNLASAIASGTVVTSGTTIGSSMTPAWVTVTFASPPTVTAGHKYAVVLQVATWNQTPAWMRWAIDSTSSAGYPNYAGGEAVAATRAKSTDPWSWQAMFSVLNDGGIGTADFAFRTYVGAAAVTPSPTIPSQPPTDATAPLAGAGGAGGALLVGVLALVAAAALALPRPRGRRRA
jgi:hypothetical protein